MLSKNGLIGKTLTILGVLPSLAILLDVTILHNAAKKKALQWTTGKWDTSTKWDTSKIPLNLLEIHDIGSLDNLNLNNRITIKYNTYDLHIKSY